MDIFSYQKNLTPVLDKNRKFVLFSNNKVAQKSMIRYILKDRAIVYKSGHDVYNNEISTYDSFDKQFKFTFVRNPWDKVVSAFHYLQQQTTIISNDITFEKFIIDILQNVGEDFDPHFNSQYKKVYYNNEKFVDFVGYFEKMNTHWKLVSDYLGCSGNLPHIGPSKHGHYSKYYTDVTRDIVGNLYSDDLLLGYSFNNDVVCVN